MGYPVAGDAARPAYAEDCLLIAVSVFVFVYFAINVLFARVIHLDELQHIQLAWSATHFGSLVYRDLFDNHGPVYPFVNQLLLKLLGEEKEMLVLLSLRFLSLLFLGLNVLICFLLFRVLRAATAFLLFGPLIFLMVPSSVHSIEVRPDGLQVLFQNLGLLLLFYSIQKRNRKIAFISGAIFAFMLLTNLKSAAVICGLLAALLWRPFCQIAKGIIPVFFASLVSTYALGLLCIGIFYSLPGYFKYNVLLNILILFEPSKVRSFAYSQQLYLEENLFMSLFLVLSLIYWIIRSAKMQTPVRQMRLAFGIMLAVMLGGKAAGLWLQYDLCFLLLLGFVASWSVFDTVRLAFLRQRVKGEPSAPGVKVSAVIMFMAICFYWHFYSGLSPANDTFIRAQKGFEEIKGHLQPGDRTENLQTECGSYGFYPHASFMFFRTPVTMKLEEKIEGREIYSDAYQQFLEKQQVKVLIGNTSSLRKFPPGTRVYISRNYHNKGCYWLRKTSFEPLPVP